MDGILKQNSFNNLKKGKVKFDENITDIEDLRYALLRNLSLSFKENLSDEEAQELKEVRTFIEQYNILY